MQCYFNLCFFVSIKKLGSLFFSPIPLTQELRLRPSWHASSVQQKNEGQRGSCSFRAARVFSVGLPSLSSESMTADSVRMIFEDVKNLVNKIDKNHNEMEEEVVTLDSGSDVSLLPKKTLEELRRIYFGLQIPKLPRWNTWSGRSQTCRTTCSLVCGWRLCSHVRLDGIWASTATIW